MPLENEIQDLAAAMRELTIALRNNQLTPGVVLTPPEEPTPEPEPEPAPAPKPKAATKAAPAPKAQPKAAVAAVDPAEPTGATQGDGEVSQGDVRAAALAAIKAGKSADVKKALAKAGAAQISDLEPETYPEVLKALKALLK